jgi:DNA-directed RNA polymerase specialized sigma subunit
MTETLESPYAALVGALEEMPDLEQYKAIKDLEERFTRDMKQRKAAIATRLHDGRSWGEVGKLLGVTGSRAEQISRAAR